MILAAGTWHLARSSGWVAWLLLGCTVVWGALAAGRMVAGRTMPRWLLELHRHLSWLTVVLLAVHLGALLADDYVEFGVADVLLPGAAAWRTAAVAWGVVALWLLLIVQVSSLRQLRLTRRWWRRLHLLSYPAWCLGGWHGVQAGTDAGTTLVRLLVAATVSAVSFVVIGRMMQLGRGRRPSQSVVTATLRSRG
ncbi:MAG: ferric reductase-like transmembrane domain-containing protein [Ilumatobacteraceae bacterium]